MAGCYRLRQAISGRDRDRRYKSIIGHLGISADRIYTDRGFTGTNRERPGPDQALAAVHSGHTLVVPKLDRLARCVPDARGKASDRG